MYHALVCNDVVFQANRVEKFEIEISKYKEKLNELDFYKTRVEVQSHC